MEGGLYGIKKGRSVWYTCMIREPVDSTPILYRDEQVIQRVFNTDINSFGSLSKCTRSHGYRLLGDWIRSSENSLTKKRVRVISCDCVFCECSQWANGGPKYPLVLYAVYVKDSPVTNVRRISRTTHTNPI